MVVIIVPPLLPFTPPQSDILTFLSLLVEGGGSVVSVMPVVTS